jgi:hypothetical protein
VNGLDSSALTNLTLPPLTNDRTAATLGSEFCPANKNAASGEQKRYFTFAGGPSGAGMQVACDGSNINPVALTLLQLKLPDGTYVIPTPQRTTVGATGASGFSSFSIPSTFREDQILVNTDYVISTKHNLSERFFYDRVPQQRSFSPTNNVPGSPVAIKFTDENARLTFTSVLTNNFVNEVRASYVRDNTFTVGLGIPSAASLGITPVDKFFPEPPAFVFGGSLGSFSLLGTTGNDWFAINDTFQFGDQISWVHGKQTIRAGGVIERNYWHLDGNGRARGIVTFGNFTDFLLGQSAAQNGSPQGFSNINSLATGQEANSPTGGIQPLMLAWSGSTFVQDDIKVTSRLTLNLGLRWEYIPGNWDKQGKSGNFNPALASAVPIPPAGGTFVGNTVAANYDPTLINPYTGNPFGPLPAGVFQRTTKTLYSNNAPLNNFAPRFGFAWQPGRQQSRLVVRGGYGWFYNTNAGNAIDTAGLTTAPYAQRINNAGVAAGFSTLAKPYPVVTLGFVPRIANPTCSNGGAGILPTSSCTQVPALSDVTGGPKLKTTMVQQWSLNTQYQLFSNWTVELGYVGAFGTHLLITNGYNQPSLASASNPVNCGWDGVLTDCITTNTALNVPLRVPILGEAATSLQGGSFSGNSWYHSLQATVRKRLSRGLTASVAYTFSKAEAETFFFNDLYTPEWGAAGSSSTTPSFDRRHRVSLSYSYDFPTTPFQSNTFARTALGGWSLSGITTVQTGNPLTLTDANGGKIYGSAGISTITFCPGMDKSSLVTPGSTKSRLNTWINNIPTVICSAPTVGNSTGYGNAGVGVITGPGQFNWDMSLGKMTKVGGIREDARLQFRAEFYNAFNHAQFANPGTAVSTSSTFGKITGTSVAPRLIQFGLKYIF